MKNNMDNNENGIELANIFLIYVKQLFRRNDNSTLFDDEGIDDKEKDGNVSRYMEYLYDETRKYKDRMNKNPKRVDIIDVSNDEDFELRDFLEYNELYVLTIDNNNICMSQTLMSLMLYLLSNYDYTDINWAINKIV